MNPNYKYFNPRSRVGNDSRDRIVYLANLYFNPRSRVGNDVRGTGTDCITGGFQSTFPRGERRCERR